MWAKKEVDFVPHPAVALVYKAEVVEMHKVQLNRSCQVNLVRSFRCTVHRYTAVPYRFALDRFRKRWQKVVKAIGLGLDEPEETLFKGFS